MNELIKFLTSTEVVIVYIVAGALIAICLLIYAIDRGKERRKKRHNTNELNKLVDKVQERIQEEKKERLVTEEASSNNELINLNLQSYLIPRKLACKQFNKLFNMNIDVKPRSDIMNVIKTEQSAIVSKDFEEKEGEVDEQIYD